MDRPHAQPLTTGESAAWCNIALEEQWIILDHRDGELVRLARALLCRALTEGDVPWSKIETSLAILGLHVVL